MTFLRRIFGRWRALFGKGSLDQEMDEEMRAHVEMRTQANLAAGMSSEEAKRAALREFGWVESLKETCRDARGLGWIENIAQDLHFGARQLRKNPGFTCAAVLCVALGIGATTGIFSVVNSVLLRPLPYSKPQQLVRLYTEFPQLSNGGGHRFGFSMPEYFDLKRGVNSWDGLETWQTGQVDLAGQNEPVCVTAAAVTGGLLSMLGVPPAAGRWIGPEDDKPGASKTVNISFGLWQRAFGGDSSIIGRDVLVDGSKYSVVGIMPRGFNFPPGELNGPEVWVPMQPDPAHLNSRGNHSYSVLGRLKLGVTLAQARGELDSFGKHFQETAPVGTHGFGGSGHPIVSYNFQDEVVRGVKPALRMLLGAVCFLLLIACVNVANLLLARAEVRRKELAIRGALGAGLRRLTVQFLTEGLLLSSIGAGLGLFLAYGGLQWVKSANEPSFPRVSEIAMDHKAFLFSVATCLAIGLVFGLTPILHAVKQNFQGSLKASTTTATGSVATQRSRHSLVIAELALALILLTGSGLMLRAFWNLQNVHTGFKPAAIVTGYLSLPSIPYSDDQARVSFWTRLEERLAAIPGVESAALVTGLPPRKNASYSDVEIEGFVSTPNGPAQNVEFYTHVSKDYFKTLGIRLVEGRFFDQRDGPGAPDVVVINQTMARTFWKGQSPIGRRLRPSRNQAWCTVVGVAEDVKNLGLVNPIGTEVYFSMGQTYVRRDADYSVALRSHDDPVVVIGALRRELHDLDASIPLSRVQTLNEVVSASQSRPRFLTTLLATFSAVALILAAVGTYGVISYSVAQRTREFGLRMALGARGGEVLGLVLGRGMTLALAGILIGLLGAFLLTRFLSTMLFGVTATDPVTFALVAALMGVVAFFATYIPARRATRVDPMEALRQE